jgi:hypothetical protein
MQPMLTLDPTTLFYFSLRDDDCDHEGFIQDWAARVPRNAKPGNSYRKSTPSLTRGSTRGSRAPRSIQSGAPPSTRSALNSVKISGGIQVAEGGLPDADKTRGCERDAAIKSPMKGNKRVRSSVSYCLSFITRLCLTLCDRAW